MCHSVLNESTAMVVKVITYVIVYTGQGGNIIYHLTSTLWRMKVYNIIPGELV